LNRTDFAVLQLVMGLFGEFENLGVTRGPISGGLVRSACGIQAAFLTFAVTSLLVAVVAGVTVAGRTSGRTILAREEIDDYQLDRV
jgi:predicted MFS family arabinose efflux permease